MLHQEKIPPDFNVLKFPSLHPQCTLRLVLNAVILPCIHAHYPLLMHSKIT